MKKCLMCGSESLDSALTCSACGEGSFGARDPAPVLTEIEPELALQPMAQPHRGGRRGR